MSHEMTNVEEMSSYFSKKFAPAVPVFVIGRSYKSDPIASQSTRCLTIGWTVPTLTSLVVIVGCAQ